MPGDPSKGIGLSQARPEGRAGRRQLRLARKPGGGAGRTDPVGPWVEREQEGAEWVVMQTRKDC